MHFVNPASIIQVRAYFKLKASASFGWRSAAAYCPLALKHWPHSSRTTLPTPMCFVSVKMVASILIFTYPEGGGLHCLWLDCTSGLYLHFSCVALLQSCKISCLCLYSKRRHVYLITHPFIFMIPETPTKHYYLYHMFHSTACKCSFKNFKSPVSSCKTWIAVLIPVSVQTERANNITWLALSILVKHHWHRTSICTLFSSKVVAVVRHARPTRHKKLITLLGNLSDHTFFQKILYSILCSPYCCQ